MHILKSGNVVGVASVLIAIAVPGYAQPTQRRSHKQLRPHKSSHAVGRPVSSPSRQTVSRTTIPNLFVSGLPKRLYARDPQELLPAGTSHQFFLPVHVDDIDKSGMFPKTYQQFIRNEFGTYLCNVPNFKLSHKSPILGFNSETRTEAYDALDNHPYVISLNPAELIGYLNDELKNESSDKKQPEVVNESNLDKCQNALRFVIGHEYAHLQQYDALHTKYIEDHRQFAERATKIPEVMAMSRVATHNIISAANNDITITDGQAPFEFDEENTRRLECQADIMGSLFTYKRLYDDINGGHTVDQQSVEDQMRGFMDVIASIELVGNHPDRLQREDAAREGQYMLEWLLEVQKQKQSEAAEVVSSPSSPSEIDHTGADDIVDTTEDYADRAAFLRDTVLKVTPSGECTLSETLSKAERIMRYPNLLLGTADQKHVEDVILVDADKGTIQPYKSASGHERYKRQYPYHLTIRNNNNERTVILNIQIDWFDRIPNDPRRYGTLRLRQTISNIKIKPGEPYKFPVQTLSFEANAAERKLITANQLDNFTPPLPIVSFLVSTPPSTRVTISNLINHSFGKTTLYGLRGVLESGNLFDVEWVKNRRQAENYKPDQNEPLIVRPKTSKATWGSKTILVHTPFPLWNNRLWAESDFFDKVIGGHLNLSTGCIEIVR